MKRVIVRGVDCTFMERFAAMVHLLPAGSAIRELFVQKMQVMQGANRLYLRKRSTKRLVKLLAREFWKAPVRSAPIFEVLSDRASAASRKAVAAAKTAHSAG